MKPAGGGPLARADRREESAGWAIALVCAVATGWAGRLRVIPDAVAYLDIAQEYLAGDWPAALNTVWPPLFSWQLMPAVALAGPGGPWESTLAHVVQSLNLLLAFAGFRYLLAELLAWRSEVGGEAGASWTGLSPVRVRWIASGVFFALTTAAMDVLLTPDLVVAACAYLVAGLLTRIARGSATWRVGATLGAAIGVGYLAKSVFLPLTPFVLVAVYLLRRGHPGAHRMVLVTGAAALTVCTSFALLISADAGRLTFGDSGRINYGLFVTGDVSYVDRTPYEDADTGILFFADEHPGTYPAHHDRVPWEPPDLVTPRLGAQLTALYRNTQELLRYLLQTVLVPAIVLLSLLAARRAYPRGLLVRLLAVVTPAVVALGAFALVYVLPRYVHPWVLILVGAVLAFVRFDESRLHRRHVAALALVLTCVSWALAARATIDIVRGSTQPDQHGIIADALAAVGVAKGDRVAVLGQGYECYWARLAGVRLAAQITDPARYWTASDDVRQRQEAALLAHGVRALVTQEPHPFELGPGWVVAEDELDNLAIRLLPGRAEAAVPAQ